MLDEYKNAKSLVIKIGSALLVEDDTLNRARLEGLARDVYDLRQSGCDVIIVSSGALALGCAQLNLARPALSLEQSQAAAAAGQSALIQAWQEVFAAHKIHIAQILLTSEDTEQRRRYLNARGTLQSLLKFDVIPIINENDTIATQELRYGDNDRLAARVAMMMSADCLVLLSDVDGLYTQSPKRAPDSAEHIARIEKIDDTILAMGGESDSRLGSGGMKTKLAAAQMATEAGCHMILASGRPPKPLTALAEGARASVFVAAGDTKTGRKARKIWIGGSLHPKGTITIDSGAEKALREGKSLLAVGITAIEGDFERGDCVRILNQAAQELARGLIAYPAAEAQKIIGRNSQEINTILGYQRRAAMIDRDDLAWSK